MTKKEALLSPLGIFIIYILSACLIIIGFRLIFPGEAVPLAYFSVQWRVTRGFLNFLDVFPALAFSALVIPFGLQNKTWEKMGSFSPQFLQSLKSSIVSAIVAALLYGVLFSLVLPLTRDYEANLRFQGRLYTLAKEQAQENADKGEWDDTARFLAVCERIWPNNPEIAKLKTESDIHAAEDPMKQGRDANSRPELSSLSGLPGPQPVDAADAIDMATLALAEERFFDANWLATLGSRLAQPGSPEQAQAVRLAGIAWGEVNSLAPTNRETTAYNTYRLKREGHEALLAEEWIRAYYIFLDLVAIDPKDPDSQKYLSLSEEGVRQVAFFIDEIELTLGRIFTGTVFSLPMGSGRLVMRISSLSTFPDTAYGIGMELIAFDQDGRPLWALDAPYAKLFPLVRGDSSAGTAGMETAVLFRALDRMDKVKSWGPQARSMGQSAPSGVQLSLSVSWEDFILLSGIHRGISGLSPVELRQAAGSLDNYGYQPEVFEAELLRRFTEPLFFLPLAVFAVVIGWRYRAHNASRFTGILMLGVLPVVFNGAEYFARGWMDNLGIWAVVSLGFTTAAIFFGAGILVLFIISLIVLAAQHS